MGTNLKKLIAWLPLLTLLPLLTFASGEMDFDELWATAGKKTFNPLSIANCELWLDASDSSTVLTEGIAVTNWMDKSTAGNDAVSIGASSTRPTACPAELNNLCTIGFDGGDYLATNYKSVDGQIVFFVGKVASPGRYAFGARDVPNTRSILYCRHDNGVCSCPIGADADINGSTSFGDYVCFVVMYDGSNVNGWVNGVLEINKAQSGSGANSTRGYYIGTFNNMGSAYSGMMIGEVAEILVYKSVLGTAERQQVEAYLMDKWGIQ